MSEEKSPINPAVAVIEDRLEELRHTGRSLAVRLSQDRAAVLRTERRLQECQLEMRALEEWLKTQSPAPLLPPADSAAALFDGDKSLRSY